jgi:hypothetical protein
MASMSDNFCRRCGRFMASALVCMGCLSAADAGTVSHHVPAIASAVAEHPESPHVPEREGEFIRATANAAVGGGMVIAARGGLGLPPMRIPGSVTTSTGPA